jgi:hypothetical protein
VTTLHDFGGVLGMAFEHLLLGLLLFHGHGSWLSCEVALKHYNKGHKLTSQAFVLKRALQPRIKIDFKSLCAHLMV